MSSQKILMLAAALVANDRWEQLSGFNKPSQVNQEPFEQAVEDVTRVATSLITALVTNAAPRDRAIEIAKARVRAAKRFGQ